MKIVESIMTKNPCYTAGRKITVKGLMLHSVGCAQPSASVFINLFNKASYNNACVHAFIDANSGTIYQTLPWNHRGWHAGGAANNTHIGVEMCEPNCIKYTSGAAFTCTDYQKARAMAKRTYDAAVELFAKLCKEYNLDPLADGAIVSHCEGYKRGIASGHGDPEHLWNGLGMGYTMTTFRQAVKAKMQEGMKTVEELAREVIAGKWGSGMYRKERLEAAGYDYAAVQAEVNAMLSGNTKKTVDELAREVIAGKWGSGATRKQLLTDAGYDYNAVQKRVNEMLKG